MATLPVKSTERKKRHAANMAASIAWDKRRRETFKVMSDAILEENWVRVELLYQELKALDSEAFTPVTDRLQTLAALEERGIPVPAQHWVDALETGPIPDLSPGRGQIWSVQGFEYIVHGRVAGAENSWTMAPLGNPHTTLVWDLSHFEAATWVGVSVASNTALHFPRGVPEIASVWEGSQGTYTVIARGSDRTWILESFDGRRIEWDLAAFEQFRKVSPYHP